MRHVFIMNPLSSVKPWKDTTYFLMLAAFERGHQVGYLDQGSISLFHDQLRGHVTWLKVSSDHNNPFVVSSMESVEMSQIDVVWLRTNPPVDRRYFYTSLLLDFLPPTTRVINRPYSLRNWNEKISALFCPQFTPVTLISNSINEIKDFAELHGRVVVKPIDGFGGKDIVFYHHTDNDAILHQATHNEHHWVIVQQYLNAAEHGDKRILLLEGEPLGAILRIHAEGVELNNLDAGAIAHPSQLTARDVEICAALKPGLRKQGGFFVGIDVIGDMLIEINITSPTGLQELCRFDDKMYHYQIIDRLEQPAAY